jgi:hypothetical protein
MRDDPTAIRDELRALFSQPGLAEKMRWRMEQPLFADGNEEEWARAELRSNVRLDAGLFEARSSRCARTISRLA